MKFKELDLKGVFKIYSSNHNDKRGYFSRIYCKDSFKKKGLNYNWPQLNKSFNKKKYTFRGLHYQKKPYEEVKIVKCIRGEIIDLALDIRKKSKTYLKLIEIKLSSNENSLLYLPKGIAHGFLTTKNNTEIFYMHSKNYSKQSSVGINIFDKKIKTKIKKKIKIISTKDKNLENLDEL